MYLQSKNIPELEGLTLSQRQQRIDEALATLSPLQKITIRLIKILFLFPLFWLLTDYRGMVSIVLLLITVVAYPLVTRPIELNFVASKLKNTKEL